MHTLLSGGLSFTRPVAAAQPIRIIRVSQLGGKQPQSSPQGPGAMHPAREYFRPRASELSNGFQPWLCFLHSGLVMFLLLVLLAELGRLHAQMGKTVGAWTSFSLCL